MEKPQDFNKKVFTYVVAVVIAAVGSFAVGYAGFSPVGAAASVSESITQARCRSGAFIAHSAVSKSTVNLDANPMSSVLTLGASSQIASSVATGGVNLIPNPSVEQLTNGVPSGWASQETGSLTASFSQVLGHSSPRAVRVDVSSYSNGAAYWTPGFVTVSPGGYYQFSDYYRANVPTSIILYFKDAAGSVQTTRLAMAPMSLSWAPFVGRFTVPQGATSVQVVQAATSVGSLETDDDSLDTASPSGFTAPMVSIVFSQGFASVTSSALPVLQDYGLTSTVYVPTGYIGKPGYLTASQLYALQQTGSEVAAQTVDDVTLPKLGPSQLDKQLDWSSAGLTKCFNSATDMAYPYGAYDETVIGAVKAKFETALSTDQGLNTADYYNPFALKVETVLASTTQAQISGWLSQAKSDRAWLILVYHQVGGPAGQYDRSITGFEADMQQVVTSGLDVDTIHQAYQSATAPSVP